MSDKIGKLYEQSPFFRNYIEAVSKVGLLDFAAFMRHGDDEAKLAVLGEMPNSAILPAFLILAQEQQNLLRNLITAEKNTCPGYQSCPWVEEIWEQERQKEGKT